MSAIAAKLVTGVITTGVLGGGAYGIYYITDTTNTVSFYLKQKGFTETPQGSSEEWDKVLKTYNLEKTEDLKIESNLAITATTIKDWCKENLEKNIKSIEDPLFKKASKWCVKYQTIKEKLGTTKTVQVAGTLNSSYEQFPQKVKESIQKIELTPKTKAHTNGEKTVKWCEQNLDRSHSEDSEFFFENTQKYCFAS